MTVIQLINLRSTVYAHFTPSLHQCSVLRVFKASKATQQGGKSKQGCNVPIETGTSRSEGLALTSCAILAPK